MKRCGLFALIIFSPVVANAQSFLYSEAEKAVHIRKKSGQFFTLSEKLGNQDKLPVGIKGVEVPVPGYLYSADLPSGAGEYDGMPSCVQNQVRVIPRSEREDSFLSLDAFIYQFNDPEQKNKAKAFGSKAVPFIEGALSNPYRPQGDTEQTIIRALGIQCLPTRVRSISRDGQKFFEYREGNKSWKSQDSE